VFNLNLFKGHAMAQTELHPSIVSLAPLAAMVVDNQAGSCCTLTKTAHPAADSQRSETTEESGQCLK
jgi:hypothetical protein